MARALLRVSALRAFAAAVDPGAPITIVKLCVLLSDNDAKFPEEGDGPLKCTRVHSGFAFAFHATTKFT